MNAHDGLHALPTMTAMPRTIAFTSGKGGVGKSSLALNTGLALARRSRRVVLVDGDLGLASLTVMLGLAVRWDVRDVIAGRRALRDIVLRGPHGLRIVPAGSGIAELANLDAGPRGDLLAELATLGDDADFVLIDTGAGINETVCDLVLASDEAIVVTRPEPTALADAYALIKVIVQSHPAYPFHVLVNMVRDEAQGRQVFDAISEILFRFLQYRPGDAGAVTTDPAVARAVVHQAPFTLVAPRCAASRAVDALATRIAGAERPGPRLTFWERLGRVARSRA